MDDLRRRYLHAIGVPVWVRRGVPGAPSARGEGLRAEEVTVAADESMPGEPLEELRALAAAAAVCTRCALHRSRTQAVFGVGNPHAELMVVGEGPGADEDRQGEPFVGRAGRLLNAMLRAIGLERDEVYIANIVKCRPPGNRDPKPEEVAACQSYLRGQIELVSPRVILAVGRVAAQNLLDTGQPVGSLRRRRYTYPYSEPQVPVVVTYHPAYLLRSPVQKRKAWEDLQLAWSLLSSQGP